MILNEYGQPYTRYIPGVERYLDGVPYSSNKEYLAAINSRIKELEHLAAKVSMVFDNNENWNKSDNCKLFGKRRKGYKRHSA